MATKHDNACLMKAKDDEPIFVLRAQDLTAPNTIRSWISRNEGRLGSDHPKIKAAYADIDLFQEWADKNGGKLPD